MPNKVYKRGAVWWAYVTFREGGRTRVSTHCTDRRAALAELVRIERELTGAVQPTPQAYPVEQALTDLLLHGLSDLSAGSRDYYDGKTGPLNRILGKRDVNALTRDIVQAYIEQRLGPEAVKQHTVFKELVTLRKALRLAQEGGVLRTAPNAIIPRFRMHYVPRDRHLTPQEFERVLPALPAKRRIWLWVACYTGARAKELRALRWEDIDFSHGFVHLRGEKTSRADRFVPLHPLLRAQLELVPKRERVGVVLERWGKGLRDLKLACEMASKPKEGESKRKRQPKIERINWNDCRRTYASWMKEQGAESAVVARLLGHSTSAMVDRVYGHFTDDALRRAVAMLPTFLKRIK